VAEGRRTPKGAVASLYRRRIERLVADCDPRHVEALMRLGFGTLDRLCAQRFRHEARRAAAVARADPPARRAQEPGAVSDGIAPARSTAPLAAQGAGRRLIAPDPDVPHWREADGARHSYGSLRSGLEPRHAADLADAQLRAIARIVAAALAADERGDHAETARLAAAAGRLCGEIRGLWPAGAVEVPRR
jgi:hypothetical protein